MPLGSPCDRRDLILEAFAELELVPEDHAVAL